MRKNLQQQALQPSVELNIAPLVNLRKEFSDAEIAEGLYVTAEFLRQGNNSFSHDQLTGYYITMMLFSIFRKGLLIPPTPEEEKLCPVVSINSRKGGAE